MKVIRKLWGLLVDDGRLASILMIALILASGVSFLLHHRTIAAGLIWLGLIVSLVVSVEHQLKAKLKS